MKKALMISTALLLVTAYDNKTAWKLDADGKLELKDGNPVFVDSAGKELVIDQNTISRLNGEARGHREGKEAAEAKLKGERADGVGSKAESVRWNRC